MPHLEPIPLSLIPVIQDVVMVLFARPQPLLPAVSFQGRVSAIKNQTKMSFLIRLYKQTPVEGIWCNFIMRLAVAVNSWEDPCAMHRVGALDWDMKCSFKP